MKAYPAMLVMEGRRAVVVGSGQAAADRADELLAVGADVVVIADEPGPEIRARAAEGSIRLVDREWRYYDVDGASVVIAASGDPDLDASVAHAARKADIWVNVSGEPTLSTFFVPAVIRRGDFTVAVSTSGVSPVLSEQVRDSLAGQFTPAWDSYVSLLGQVREWAASHVPDTARRRELMENVVHTDLIDRFEAGERPTLDEVLKSFSPHKRSS
jgi:precorrin-2 dehydrogenase/sirohydrochlorin ferrochelatase